MIAPLMLLGLAGPSTTNNRSVDVNGVPITVGMTVKLVGVVTSINAFDTGYQSIKISALHPSGQTIIYNPATGQAAGPYGFEGAQLVVGS